MSEVLRHRTALRRAQMSRPVRIACDDEVISPTSSVFDFGCGHGDDVRRLQERGIVASGWDPAFCPRAERTAADVVNLGYVINVIEEPDERVDTLRAAWELARRVLIVSARLTDEARPDDPSRGDGCMTRLGTFQKFYEQNELRSWLEGHLGEPAVSAAPGVFYVFRERAARETFVAARYRRAAAIPHVRRSESIFQDQRELFEALAAFVAQRGRVPNDMELAESSALRERVGSIARAFSILCRVAGSEQWEAIREARTEDLLVYLALARFSGRPRFAALTQAMQLDVRAFFTSYRAGCELADALLYAAGSPSALEDAVRGARVGKVTPAALYCHVSALPELPSLLRIYEGCARGYIGHVEGANLVKLHRDEPRVSYLSYPRFDQDAHPTLASSVVVTLRTFGVQFRDFVDSANPPVLHRKETFVGAGYPLRATFSRLTEQEERLGLLEPSATIGTRDGWQERLQAARVRVRGHRVVRA